MKISLDPESLKKKDEERAPYLAREFEFEYVVPLNITSSYSLTTTAERSKVEPILRGVKLKASS